MTIRITDKVGFEPDVAMGFAISLIKKGKKENSLDYGGESHGLFDITTVKGKILNKPIFVIQTNKRKTENSPINIEIKYHESIF